MTRLAAVAGFLTVIWLVVLVLWGGAAFPGYDHVGQYISELGARGAPTAGWVSWAGFLPIGVLIWIFCLGAGRALPGSRGGLLLLAYYGLGYSAAAFFPCDPGCRPPEPSLSQVIHNLIGVTGYWAGPIALIVLGFRARRWPGRHALAPWGWICGAVALIASILILPDLPFVGLAQRVLEAAMMTWIALCSASLWRQPASG